MATSEIVVPRFYQPWPHQLEAWKRMASGKYNYYFMLWARQAGKDATCRAFQLKRAWDNPGSQSVYVGIDNAWIKENVFLKNIDGRTMWMDYPSDLIDVNNTERRVSMLNNPKEKSPATVKFMGFKNENGIIGASYDDFVFTELSLFPKGALDYIEPMWENKLAQQKPLNVLFNFTPRGMRNIAFDTLKAFTGKDEPEEFAGEHDHAGRKVYVDIKRAHDIFLPDGTQLFTEQRLEQMKQRHLRAHGNLNLFNQEYMVNFLTVNAGLVYQGLEFLQKENRYTSFNLDTSKPVYVAWDLSSKSSRTDWTSGIVFQWIAGRMMIYDYIEDRAKPFAEIVSEMAQRPYWMYVRCCIVPWDAERSYSSVSAIDEVKHVFPHINWRQLGKESVMRGINEVRKKMPNMWINKDNCDWVMECLNNYEFKSYVSNNAEDYTAEPIHNRYSHICDAIRYAAMGVNEISYLGLNEDGGYAPTQHSYVTCWDSDDTPQTEKEFIPGTSFMRDKKQTGLTNVPINF